MKFLLQLTSTTALISLFTTLGLLFLGKANAFTITTFSPTGFSDEVAGITGYEIEDFEDTTLIPGLSVEWTSPDLASTNTLSTTYNPSSQGFTNNAWDGSNTLNNTRQSPYLSAPISSITTFNFSNSPNSVGFGVSNLQFAGAVLMVNGSDFANFSSLSPAPVFSRDGQNIYIRVDADSHETINSVGVRGASGDFLTFDHLAVNSTQAVPEPMTILGTLAALGFGTFFKRQQDRKL